MPSHVEQQIGARIAVARVRCEQQRQERAERAVRRRAGVDARNRAKLNRLGETDRHAVAIPDGNRGDHAADGSGQPRA
ncbi:hypothetical protein ACIHBQ_04940 [Streptomyces sp. NPDC052492]|uniref:hypothetical protein n=1 Tax=Streptomyces sp. NPDC052492 TaxID=3365691 RepID=UPI0037CEFF23